jgi:hypothetical protein
METGRFSSLGESVSLPFSYLSIQRCLVIGSCWLSLSCGWLCAAGGGCAAVLLHKALGALLQPDPAVLRSLAAASLYTRCEPEIDELMFQPHPLSNSGNVWAARRPCPLSPSLPPSQ